MRVAFILLSSLLFAPASLAHADGLSFVRQAGDVLIDIGYGEEMPRAGSATTYSFHLSNTADPQAYAPEPFRTVRVRILKGRQELLDRVLKNDGADVPSLSFPYDEAGEYSMAVTYAREGKPPLDASFGFRVSKAPAPSANAYGTMAVGALCIAGAALFLLWRGKKRGLGDV